MTALCAVLRFGNKENRLSLSRDLGFVHKFWWRINLDTTVKMAAAVIRSYEAGDRKLVQFMVGKSNMEALAVANNRSESGSSVFFWENLRVRFRLLSSDNPCCVVCTFSCFHSSDELVANKSIWVLELP